MQAIDRIKTSIDRAAERNKAIGFPLAVIKKFGEDRSGQLAALIAYYSFFSLFPLMLVLVTVLGIVLAGHPGLQSKIVNSALAQFPIIGDQIRENVHSIGGSAVSLALGVVGALWAGLAGVKAAQNAMDKVWDVPLKQQPNFKRAILRALVMLLVLGGFSLVATGLAGIGTGSDTGFTALKLVSIIGAGVVNIIVFLLAFKILTVADVSWRDVLPGAIAAGIAWSILQSVGGYYVGHQLKNASQTYGLFAVVIGLLSWLYLGAQVTLLCAEINVVLRKKLWPRGITNEIKPADARALEQHAKIEERRHEETVSIDLDGDIRTRAKTKGRNEKPKSRSERSKPKQSSRASHAVALFALMVTVWKRLRRLSSA
jgi:YihY family inner membrane protein